MSNKFSKYRPDIDGLRALAVLSVFAYHLRESLLPSGFIGVDLFFVISGYVVTRSVFNISYDKASQFFINFYFRRIRRLMPALIVMIIIGCGLSLLLIPPNELKTIFDTARFGLFGLSNFILVRSALDYFGVGNDLNPFTHTWSLAVEEQFYIIFPFIFLFVSKFFLKKSWSKLFLSIALPVILSLGLFFILSYSKPIKAYYYMPLRLWQLFLGISFCYLERLIYDHKLYKLLASDTLKAFFLIIFSFCLLVETPTDSFPLLPIILGSFSGFFLLFENHNDKSILKRIFTTKLLQYFGKTSYSIYLYHFMIFAIFKWTVGLESFSTMAIASLLSFALAFASYHFIETSIRYYKVKPTRTTLTIITIGLLFFSLISVTIHNINNISKDAFTPVAFQNFKKPRTWSETVQHCHFRYYKSDTETAIKECLPKSNNKALYIVGDSHGLQLVSMAETALISLGYDIKYIHNNGIPLMLKAEVPAELKHLVNILKKDDFVLFTFFRGKLLNSKYHVPLERNPFEEDGVVDKMSNFTKIFQGFHEQINNIGAKILLVDDVPQMKTPTRVTPCIFQKKFGLPNSCDVSRKQSLHSREPMTRLFVNLKRLPNVFYWDPHNLICDQATCTFDNEKYIKMTDHNHISLDQALDLSTEFKNFILSMGI